MKHNVLSLSAAVAALSLIPLAALETEIEFRKDKLSKLTGERDELQAQLDKINASIQSLYGHNSNGNAEETSEVTPEKTFKKLSTGIQGHFVSVTERAVAILKESGKPMKIGEIARQMLLEGHKTISSPSVFGQSVASILCKKPRLFQKTAPGTYTLA